MDINEDVERDEDFLECSKLYFKVAHDEYRDELLRANRLDEKMGRLIAIVNILLVGIVAFSATSFSDDLLKTISNGSKILVILTLLILLVFTFLSWWFLITASNFSSVGKISVDDEVRSWVSSKSQAEMYISLADDYRYAIDNAQKEINKCKVEPLGKSLFFLKLSVVTLLLYLIMIFILKYGAINVTNPKDQTPQKEPVTKPMPDYQPRPLRNVNESNVGDRNSTTSTTILNEDRSGRK